MAGYCSQCRNVVVAAAVSANGGFCPFCGAQFVPLQTQSVESLVSQSRGLCDLGQGNCHVCSGAIRSRAGEGDDT